MKCASPNLDDCSTPSLLFFPHRKKENGRLAVQSGSVWSEAKVCNWRPWAGSLHCMSRRIITRGYIRKKLCFLGRGNLFNSSFSFPFLHGLHSLIERTPYQLWGVCSTFITKTSFNSCLNERSICFHNRGCNYSLYFITVLPSEVCSYIVDVCI